MQVEINWPEVRAANLQNEVGAVLANMLDAMFYHTDAPEPHPEAYYDGTFTIAIYPYQPGEYPTTEWLKNEATGEWELTNPEDPQHSYDFHGFTIHGECDDGAGALIYCHDQEGHVFPDC